MEGWQRRGDDESGGRCAAARGRARRRGARSGASQSDELAASARRLRAMSSAGHAYVPADGDVGGSTADGTSCALLVRPAPIQDQHDQDFLEKESPC
jgi:hypothetical protein